MIDVSHLTKTYGAFKAVDDFSFTTAPGEIVGLIGPNGAGTTSTLRCLVGIQAPTLGIRHMKATIVSRGRAGAAVMISSHLLHLVEEICTRIIIIDHGVKVADGTLDQLRARPELAATGSSLEQIFLSATAGDS